MIPNGGTHEDQPPGISPGGRSGGGALEWYRRTFCQAEGHTHGEAGELDCILGTLAELRAGR